jgi:hypothetical protein
MLPPQQVRSAIFVSLRAFSKLWQLRSIYYAAPHTGAFGGAAYGLGGAWVAALAPTPLRGTKFLSVPILPPPHASLLGRFRVFDLDQCGAGINLVLDLLGRYEGRPVPPRN